MWLRFTPKDPPYRAGDALIRPGHLYAGKVQIGQVPEDLTPGNSYVLDLIPKVTSLRDLLAIPAELYKPNIKGVIVLRADRTGNAEYLRSMPPALIRSYRIRKVLIEFEHAVDFQGFTLESPEALKAHLTGLPSDGRNQYTQLTRINFIEISVEPLTWQDVFFSPSLIATEEARSEIEISPLVGQFERFDDVELGTDRKSVPAILLPRDVPEALDWLSAPDFVEETSD